MPPTRARDAEGAARRSGEEQRLKAEASFKKAREAVDEYFTKVSESKLLNVPGLQPLRKELLESSRKYYQEFLKEHADEPSVRAEAAEAWYRVGFVTIAINPGKEALDAFQKAADMYDGLVRDHPDVERYAYKLAMCLNDLGNEQAALGQESKAYKTHERCLAIRREVVRAHPDVPEYLKELGIGYQVWANRQRMVGLTLDSIRSHEQAPASSSGSSGNSPTSRITSGVWLFRLRMSGEAKRKSAAQTRRCRGFYRRSPWSNGWTASTPMSSTTSRASLRACRASPGTITGFPTGMRKRWQFTAVRRHSPRKSPVTTQTS